MNATNAGEAPVIENDYSLLRPFDLEAAKRGEPVIGLGGDPYPVTFVSRSRSGKTNIVEKPGMHGGLLDDVCYAPDERLRMAPLCWVEGRPVYQGDVLYWVSQPAAPCIADNIMDGGWLAFRADPGQPCGILHPAGLTWTPPAIQREGWVNIVKSSGRDIGIGSLEDRLIRNCDIFQTKEDAERWAAQCNDVIATVPISWEEPAGGAR